MQWFQQSFLLWTQVWQICFRTGCIFHVVISCTYYILDRFPFSLGKQKNLHGGEIQWVKQMGNHWQSWWAKNSVWYGPVSQCRSQAAEDHLWYCFQRNAISKALQNGSVDNYINVLLLEKNSGMHQILQVKDGNQDFLDFWQHLTHFWLSSWSCLPF